MGGDLKFVFKFKLMIPEIGGHALAEGSRLSVPAPRKVQIFLQVCYSAPACIVVILNNYRDTSMGVDYHSQ